MSRPKDPLKEKVSRIILENIGDYIPGWLQTLGELGAPPRARSKLTVDAKTRVSAAKTGMDIVNKLLPDVSESAGRQALLEKLARAGEFEPPEGGDWTSDPKPESEEADMGGGQEPDSPNS